MRVWDVAEGRCLRVLRGHAFWVCALALSEDGRLLLSAGWDDALRLWDVASGECLRALGGHEDEVLGVALTADGRRIGA